MVRGKGENIIAFQGMTQKKKPCIQFPLVCLSNLDTNHTEHLYNHHSKGKGNLVSFIFTPILLSNRIYKWLWIPDNILTTLMHIPLAYV